MSLDDWHSALVHKVIWSQKIEVIEHHVVKCAFLAPQGVWAMTSRNGVMIYVITQTPYMVLPLFATRFADYAGGIRVSFIQPRLF